MRNKAMAASEVKLGSSSGKDSTHLSPALPQVTFNCQRSAANKRQSDRSAPRRLFAVRPVQGRPVRAASLAAEGAGNDG